MYIKEKTVPIASAPTDAGQSTSNNNLIVTENESDFNTCKKYFLRQQKEWLRSMDKSYLKTMTMCELYDQVFETNLPIVEGILYPGTYLFAGPAKIGKSFLMAQLAYHISTGLDMWNSKVHQGTVLYLALEDDYGRLQRRLFRMFGEDSTPNLHLATESRAVGEGFNDQIQGFIRKYPDTKLIIVDVLQRVRSANGKEYSYASDYEIVAKLKAMTDGLGIALLVVHHTRKQQADDIFDMISGTNGLLGAADGAFIISKDSRIANKATIDIVGRDQPDQKLYLTRNPQTLEWELEKAENELWIEPIEPVIEAIAKLFEDGRTSWQGSPTELSKSIDLDIKPNALSLRLNVNAGQLVKKFGILYQNNRCHDGRKITLTKLEDRPA